MVYYNPRREYEIDNMSRKNLQLMSESVECANESLKYARLSYESSEKARKHACVSKWAAIVSSFVALITLGMMIWEKFFN